jgi:hypothetical protein
MALVPDVDEVVGNHPRVQLYPRRNVDLLTQNNEDARVVVTF